MGASTDVSHWLGVGALRACVHGRLRLEMHEEKEAEGEEARGRVPPSVLLHFERTLERNLR